MTTTSEPNIFSLEEKLLELLLKTKKNQKFKWLINLLTAHLVSGLYSSKFAEYFTEVKTYCTFIGYPRSGHSLVAALLDAHPNIVMAHEFYALKYLQAGLSKDALYYLLFQMTRVRGHSWQRRGGYKYNVANQWQGHFDKIEVIGDKQAPFTVKTLAKNPSLLPQLQEKFQIPIKFIHVIRNPFDTITTMTIRAVDKQGKSAVSAQDLEKSIALYFELCDGVNQVKKITGPSNIFDFYHEKFIAEPRSQLKELCLWLGITPSEQYLDDCSAIVFASPRKSRDLVAWDSDLKQKVIDKINTYPFLAGYNFQA